MKLLFSFLLTVASLSAFAQQTIKISGRVTDFNDKPISNCTVMLMDGRFNAIDSAALMRPSKSVQDMELKSLNSWHLSEDYLFFTTSQ